MNNETITKQEFDLAKVHCYFSASHKTEENVVYLRGYLDAWKELCKFLDTLGTLFHFVTHDVKAKIEIIEVYIRENPEEYKTINSVIEYELAHKLTKLKSKPSGSRTIQRLHRALNYVLRFFKLLVEASPDSKCSVLSREAYDSTLGKYHVWVVRKAAQLAMMTLPTRNVLLTKIDHTPDSEQRVMLLLNDIISSGQPLYEFTEELYAKDDLLDLP